MQSTALFSLQNIFPVAFYFSLTRKFEKILFFSREYRVLGKKISTIINSQGESCLGPFKGSPHPQMVCWRTACVWSPIEDPQMFRSQTLTAAVQLSALSAGALSCCSSRQTLTSGLFVAMFWIVWAVGTHVLPEASVSCRVAGSHWVHLIFLASVFKYACCGR